VNQAIKINDAATAERDAALALEQAQQQRAFLDAMANLPTSVSLVTTGNGAQRAGLTVSAFSSLSTEPPSVVVCVNKNAGAHQALLDNGAFTVNVLGAEQQDFASLFAQKGVDRFASDAWRTGETGTPVLGGALMALECRLHQVVDGFSHNMLIGVVQRIHHQPEDAGKPLIWHQRRFASVGEP
jgi:flavin reductase